MNKVSNKFKNITKVRNIIMDKINESQDIKRLVYYNSCDPLNFQVTNTEGKLINQPEVDINFIEEEKRIHAFYMSEILKKLETHIFVRRYESNVDSRDGAIGENILTIEIAVPSVHTRLLMNEDRVSALVVKIIELIDGQDIGGIGSGNVVYIKEGTDLKTDIEFNIATIFVEIRSSNMRG